jgi:hypothetical protein
LQLTVLIVLAVAIFSEPLLHLVEMREPNGNFHVEYARKIAEGRGLYPGHFLYHLLTAAVHGILPLSWLQAHLVVVLAFRVLLAGLLWSLVRRSLRASTSANGAFLTIFFSLSLMLVSAISFPSWGQGNYYLGYIVPNVYVSQTMLALQPLALLTFFAVLRVLNAPKPGTDIRAVITMGVLASLSALAKPSYVIVLFPAVVTYLWLRHQLLIIVPIHRIGFVVLLGRWLRDFRALLTLGIGLVAPVFAVLAWVYISTYLAYQQLNITQDAGIRIAPFKVLAFHQGLIVPENQVPVWLLAKFVLSLLFPVVVAITYFPRARRDPRLALAWLQLAFGLVFMYLVAEHPSFEAANFTWSAHIALFILFVVSTLFLLEQTRLSARVGWRGVILSRAALCYVGFLFHLAAGYGMYMHPGVN